MLTGARARARRGFALMIAVVSVAVMAILATVIFASLSSGGPGSFDRITLATDILFRFKTEIIGSPPSFYERIRTYPGELHDLVEPITTSDVNSCGQPYSASPDVNNWQGPYHLIPFNETLGYTLSSGIAAQNATIRTTFTNGATALAIVMNDITLADAQAIKAKIDGTSGDTVAFTPNGDNPVVVHYRMPITSDC